MAHVFKYEGNIALEDIPYNIIDATNNKRGFAYLIFESARGFRLCEPITDSGVTYFSEINATHGSGIKTVDNIASVTGGTDDTYTITTSDYTSTSTDGTGAEFSIVISSGAVSSITITTPGQDYLIDDTITVPAANVGSTSADVTFDVASLDGLNGTVVGTAALFNNVLYKVSGSLPFGKNIIKVGDTFHKQIGAIDADSITIDNAIKNVFTTNVTAADPTLIAAPNHGLSAGDPIRFKSVYVETDTPYPLGDGTANSGIDPERTYYVDSVNLATNSFQILDQVGGDNISVETTTKSSMAILPVKEVRELVFDTTPEKSTIMAKAIKKFDGTNTTYEVEPYFVQKVIDNKIDESVTTSGDLKKVDANTNVFATGNLNVPANIFQQGDAISVLAGAASRNIVPTGGMTMYYDGTAAGSGVTLAARGTMSILFESATVCYVMGNLSAI